MFETKFEIDELDNGWYWQDIREEDDAHLYCDEELEIPSEWIKGIKIYDDGFRVLLHRSNSYFRDDWYVNLQRISA